VSISQLLPPLVKWLLISRGGYFNGIIAVSRLELILKTAGGRSRILVQPASTEDYNQYLVALFPKRNAAEAASKYRVPHLCRIGPAS